jgi:hypothetical protein
MALTNLLTGALAYGGAFVATALLLLLGRQLGWVVYAPDPLGLGFIFLVANGFGFKGLLEELFGGWSLFPAAVSGLILAGASWGSAVWLGEESGLVSREPLPLLLFVLSVVAGALLGRLAPRLMEFWQMLRQRPD